MADSKTILSGAEEKMDMAIMYLEDALAHIRAGKADVRLLDGIRVDSYGSMVPINNVAAVTTPDARSIAIKPWDKSMFRVIEKAIIDSELGIMPENNGEIIRLGIGDVTQPIAPAVIEALHKAVDEQTTTEGFKGYAPDLGYAFLRETIAKNDYEAYGCDIAADEIFVSDGAKSDSANIQEIFSLDNKIAVCDPVYPVYVDSNVMA